MEIDPAHPPESWSWQLLERIGAACGIAEALRSGLLEALGPEPRAAATLAAELGLAPRHTLGVLRLLASEGLVHHDEHGYTAAPALHDALTPVSGLGLAPLSLWRSLEDALAGRSRGWAMDATPHRRSHVYRRATPRLGRMFDACARNLATRLDCRGPILDLGCGSGVWSLAMATRDHEARVVGVDFPEVLEAMSQRARDQGLEDRTELVAADLRSDALPRGFNTVILANVLRLEPPDVARAMVLRAAESVAPGGRLVIVDALGDGSIEAERSIAVYALHLQLRTLRGQVHDSLTVRAWLEDAGIVDVRQVGVEGGPAHLGALVGTR